MEIYGRQGDLVVEKLSKMITETLEKGKAVTFAGDSSGHPHRITGAVEFKRIANGTTLLRVAKPVAITHGRGGGHKALALEPGDYEIRPLRERGDQNDRNVED
jgi:hypothetical protein